LTSQFEQDEADSKIKARLNKGEVKEDFKTRNLNHGCKFLGWLTLRAHWQDWTNGGDNLDKRENALAIINNMPTTYVGP
jgi:hypothetical protein